MDERTKNLKGSDRRDTFKRMHKELDKSFYAVDLDLCFISKTPPGTVAYVDLKRDTQEGITFAEVIKYNHLMKFAPFFVVYCADPMHGPFMIHRYLGGDWKPSPPQYKLGESIILYNWEQFGRWEGMLRQEYRKRGGWSGWAIDGDNLIFRVNGDS